MLLNAAAVTSFAAAALFGTVRLVEKPNELRDWIEELIFENAELRYQLAQAPQREPTPRDDALLEKAARSLGTTIDRLPDLLEGEGRYALPDGEKVNSCESARAAWYGRCREVSLALRKLADGSAETHGIAKQLCELADSLYPEVAQAQVIEGMSEGEMHDLARKVATEAGLEVAG